MSDPWSAATSELVMARLSNSTYLTKYDDGQHNSKKLNYLDMLLENAKREGTNFPELIGPLLCKVFPNLLSNDIAGTQIFDEEQKMIFVLRGQIMYKQDEFVSKMDQIRIVKKEIDRPLKTSLVLSNTKDHIADHLSEISEIIIDHLNKKLLDSIRNSVTAESIIQGDIKNPFFASKLKVASSHVGNVCRRGMGNVAIVNPETMRAFVQTSQATYSSYQQTTNIEHGRLYRGILGVVGNVYEDITAPDGTPALVMYVSRSSEVDNGVIFHPYNLIRIEENENGLLDIFVEEAISIVNTDRFALVTLGPINS